jgi:hypothetical protein
MVKLVCKSSCEKKQEVKPYELAVEQVGDQIKGHLVDPDTGLHVWTGNIFYINKGGITLSSNVGEALNAQQKARIPFTIDEGNYIRVVRPPCTR